MKKKIVLSVNDNPQYLYYTPLTVWAWQQFGWEPILFYHGKFTQLNELVDLMLGEIGGKTKGYVVHDIEGYRSETITQISRLYAGCVAEEGDMLMTGDIDMLPLSDYWHPELTQNKITVYGHDLTNFGHIPICYIAMSKERWVEVMGLTSNDFEKLIKRDLDSLPKAKSNDPVEWWQVDQDIITDRIMACQFTKGFLTRGVLSNGYAAGRVDRSAWSWERWQIKEAQLIDCHMHRSTFNKAWISNPKFIATMDLLRSVWPEQNFEWFVDYSYQFDQIVNAQ